MKYVKTALILATAILMVCGFCRYMEDISGGNAVRDDACEFEVAGKPRLVADTLQGQYRAALHKDTTLSRYDELRDAFGELPYRVDTASVANRLEMPRWTSCDSLILVDHMGYAVCYNTSELIPRWVAYRLSELEVNGVTERGSSFKCDPDISCTQANESDYRNSGWDRGHMAPAADMKWSSQAMLESFYLSNICPQNANLNRGDWKDLEELVRSIALHHGEVYVACGPVITSRRFGKIGENGVTVPDAFFKTLLIQTDSVSFSAVGFLMSNEAGNRPLNSYACSVDSVEAVTGIDFYCNLPDDVEEPVERTLDLSVWMD